MPSRGEGESGDDDSPRRREETKSRTPRLQPGSAGEHSAAPSAEMSSRGGGESGGHDSPRLQGESSSRNKAKSWTTSLQPGSAGEHGVEPSAAAMEKGSEFAKVDGEAPRPCFAMLGKAPTVVLSSSGKDTLNCRAVAGGLDLDPKKSGIEIQKSKFSKFSVGILSTSTRSFRATTFFWSRLELQFNGSCMKFFGADWSYSLTGVA